MKFYKKFFPMVAVKTIWHVAYQYRNACLVLMILTDSELLESISWVYLSAYSKY